MDKSWGLDTFRTYYGHVLPKCVQKVSVPTSCTSTELVVGAHKELAAELCELINGQHSIAVGVKRGKASLGTKMGKNFQSFAFKLSTYLQCCTLTN